MQGWEWHPMNQTINQTSCQRSRRGLAPVSNTDNRNNLLTLNFSKKKDLSFLRALRTGQVLLFLRLLYDCQPFCGCTGLPQA